jgi:hypothetical protein
LNVPAGSRKKEIGKSMQTVHPVLLLEGFRKMPIFEGNAVLLLANLFAPFNSSGPTDAEAL